MDAKQCERVMAGMVDGMALRTVGYPGNGELPGIRPAFDVDYERGYDVGESFARASTVMQQNAELMDAAPPASDLAHDAPAAFHAASGSHSVPKVRLTR